MSGKPSSDDDRLVALLDGEIDAAASDALIEGLGNDEALRARLSRLAEGGEGVKPALGQLLESAPLDRLDAMLDAVLAAGPIAEPAVSPRSTTRPTSWLPRWLLGPVFAALVAGVAGLWLGYSMLGSQQHEETWRDAVAGYWALTTPDTLAIEPQPDQAARELALAADRLGLPLALSALTLPEASFRGAMVFDYDGRPLTQIAYLDKDGGPFAYCVIKAPKAGETAPTAVVMGGFNVVHWSGGGYARLLIGHVPEETLKRYAALLIEKAG